VPAEPPPVDERVRDAIARAFRELRPSMIANASADADLDPKSRIDEFAEGDLEQFLNAYEALFMESLDGNERTTRRFILDTALPPIIGLGQTTLDLVRSNVISAVMMTHRLLPLIDAELRDDAARWLATFHSGYAYEVAERALALEAGRS
jgi:hypothetical protein